MLAEIRPQLTAIALPGCQTHEIVPEGLAFILYVPSRARWQARMVLDAADEQAAQDEATLLIGV